MLGQRCGRSDLLKNVLASVAVSDLAIGSQDLSVALHRNVILRSSELGDGRDRPARASESVGELRRAAESCEQQGRPWTCRRVMKRSLCPSSIHLDSEFKSHRLRMAILRKREQEREMKELEEYAPELGCRNLQVRKRECPGMA